MQNKIIRKENKVMNITEDFCSFEVAKLLEEKGFKEPVTGLNKLLFKEGENPVLRITHQKAMKWLREVHQLHISVDVCPIYGKVKDEKGRNTCGLLYWNYMASGEWVNEKYNPNQKAFVVSAKSYEEAVEAACIYALKNLI